MMLRKNIAILPAALGFFAVFSAAAPAATQRPAMGPGDSSGKESRTVTRPRLLSLGWSSGGNQVDAAYGYSVSTAGDVNGDGYSDLIVGAPLYDNGEENEGKAFVYYGSATGLSTTASWTAEGNQASANFGWSVSTAGDVNNDGYSDVLVGADTYSNDQAYEGRAYVYFGSATGLSAVANWTAESDQGGSRFGWSVSTAGDVNGDGFSDVVVGAPLMDIGEFEKGKTFIYYGSAAGPSPTPDVTGEPDQGGSLFGFSVSTAGDVNSDGYSDVIVGAKTYHNPIYQQGTTFIYLGSAAGLSPVPNWKAGSLGSLVFLASFGSSVSAAGDVNGDGKDDIIAGAMKFDNLEIVDEGKVFAYYGTATIPSFTANWATESNQSYAFMGSSVAGAGDVNNDGFADVIFGSERYDSGQVNEGKAFVYLGSPTGLGNSAVWSAEGNQQEAWFGSLVSPAGDVNGDGYADVIVGSFLYSNGQSAEGKVFVYHGGRHVQPMPIEN